MSETPNIAADADEELLTPDQVAQKLDQLQDFHHLVIRMLLDHQEDSADEEFFQRLWHATVAHPASAVEQIITH